MGVKGGTVYARLIAQLGHGDLLYFFLLQYPDKAFLEQTLGKSDSLILFLIHGDPPASSMTDQKSYVFAVVVVFPTKCIELVDVNTTVVDIIE